MNAPTFGSLFSGIGGIDLGLERAGWRCAWQCESDPYARAVLAKHWPDVPCYPDVRELDGTEPAIDLLCGGFPCQDLSVAGKRAGIDGERSGLWREFARVIGLLRPRFVLVENVPGLLAHGLGRVLGDLAACGYDAEWDCLRAADVGAPHLRERVFLVAYPECSERRPLGEARDNHRPDCDAQRQEGADRLRSGGEDVADSQSHRRSPEGQWSAPGHAHGCSELRCEPATHWLVEPAVGRVADGIPARLDRLRCLGNGVVPQVAERLGAQLMRAWQEGRRG